MQTTRTRKHILRRLRRFAKANEAVSALEYALVIGVVSTVIAAALVTFGAEISRCTYGTDRSRDRQRESAEVDD